MAKEIKTKAGAIFVPEEDEIEPRSKYWAEVLVDVIRVDELYGIVQAIRDEARQEGWDDCAAF